MENINKKMKPQIYKKINGFHGICSVWDLCKARGLYLKRNKGLKFYAYKKIAGKQHSRLFETFENAKKWRESPMLFPELHNSKQLKFAEVKLRCLEHKKSKLRISTIETYESYCKHFSFFDPLPMNQINAQAIDVWIKEIKKPEYLELHHASRVSYHHELSFLRQIFVYYSEYIEDSFQIPIKKRHNEDCIVDFQKYQQNKFSHRSKFIPREDFIRFLDFLKMESIKDQKLKPFYLIALFQLRSGLRIGEVCACTFEDIDFENETISVSKTVLWSRKVGRESYVSPFTKTGEARVIGATKDLLDELYDWKLAGGRNKGLIFSQNNFRPISYRSVQHHYNKAFNELGMSWRSSHIMRHSFATDFLMKTQNPLALQKQLGHSSLKQTEHYSKVTEELNREGIKKYSESLNGAQKKPTNIAQIVVQK